MTRTARPTWQQLGTLGEWLAECRASNIADSTLIKRRDVIRGVEALIGTPLTEASERQVRTWWLTIAGLAVRTRATRLSHVRGYCRWLVREDIRPDDPTRKISHPRIPRSLPRDVDPAVAQQALAVIPDERVHAAGELLFRCGLRIIEVAGIRPARDLIRRGDGRTWLRVTGKGGHEREVPISEELAARLRDLAGAGWLLPSAASTSGHLTPDYLGSLVAGALRDGGLDATSHQLRHTAATRALQETGDITAAQLLLGHRQLSTTQVYARAKGLDHDVITHMYEQTQPTGDGEHRA